MLQCGRHSGEVAGGPYPAAVVLGHDPVETIGPLPAFATLDLNLGDPKVRQERPDAIRLRHSAKLFHGLVRSPRRQEDLTQLRHQLEGGAIGRGTLAQQFLRFLIAARFPQHAP